MGEPRRPSRSMHSSGKLPRPSNSAVALSLALAAFALVLQMSSRSVEHMELVMTGGA